MFLGHPLTKISAPVADVFEAGTNSIIYLKLKNSKTGENCETLALDTEGNNWWRGYQETFEDSTMLAPCGSFYPTRVDSLKFNFREEITWQSMGTSNDLILTEVTLHFGPELSFTWRGRHTFNIANSNSWLSLK